MHSSGTVQKPLAGEQPAGNVTVAFRLCTTAAHRLRRWAPSTCRQPRSFSSQSRTCSRQACWCRWRGPDRRLPRRWPSGAGERPGDAFACGRTLQLEPVQPPAHVHVLGTVQPPFVVEQPGEQMAICEGEASRGAGHAAHVAIGACPARAAGASVGGEAVSVDAARRSHARGARGAGPTAVGAGADAGVCAVRFQAAARAGAAPRTRRRSGTAGCRWGCCTGPESRLSSRRCTRSRRECRQKRRSGSRA